MQAVILAGGYGNRMGELTKDTPKPLLKVSGKTLLEHKLDILPSEIDEVIIVVGYLGQKIIDHIGESYNGIKISYVTQEERKGTGHALWLVKDLLKDKFMVLMGDDIYDKKDLEACIKNGWSILIKEVDFLKAGGLVTLKPDGSLDDIVEGDSHNLKNASVYTGLCVLNKDIFNYDLVKIPGKEEFGLPQTIVLAAKDFPVQVVKSSFFLQLTRPEDLKAAEEAFAQNGKG